MLWKKVKRKSSSITISFSWNEYEKQTEEIAESLILDFEFISRCFVFEQDDYFVVGKSI